MDYQVMRRLRGFDYQKMGTRSHNFRRKIIITYLILTSISLLGLFLSFKLLLQITSPSSTLRVNLPLSQVNKNLKWLQLIRNYLPEQKIRVGFLNINEKERQSFEAHGPLILNNIHVSLDHISENVTWKSLYPEWINEEASNCSEIPLPQLKGSDADIDVIVARLPCERLRGVFRLQVNLAVANLAVQSGLRRADQTVYVVFIGSCGPMHEIFKCDERVSHMEDYWVYKPYLPRLKHKLLMPVGSCLIAPPFAQFGQEAWRPKTEEKLKSKAGITLPRRLRVAYVTVLHTSEAYVCGAIALAQSIRQSGSHKDMILLHDHTISNKSLIGLSAAGWNLRLIDRIRSPFPQNNGWNYTKLRVWQVTDYDKLVYIDADFIILKTLDNLFYYPQLSASGNDKALFHSGIMVLEPSACMFKDLMEKLFKMESYNGGDQGFLNEIFVWWHRLSNHVDDLGLKPWVCYRDYDCTRRVYTSGLGHKEWCKVYEKMSEQLKGYCGLNKNMEKTQED